MNDAQALRYTKAISTALAQSTLRTSAEAIPCGVLDQKAFTAKMLAIMEEYKLSQVKLPSVAVAFAPESEWRLDNEWTDGRNNRD